VEQPPPNYPSPGRPTRSTNTLLIVVFVLIGVVVCVCGFAGFLIWSFDSGGEDVPCFTLADSGRWHDAIPACREYVLKDPASGPAQDNLAWCLTLDHQVPEGLKEARIATEFQPDANSYNALAMALALSGSAKEAMKVETEHVLVNGEPAKDSEDAEDTEFTEDTEGAERITLGMVYYANGEKDKARVQWSNAARSENPTVRDLAQRFVTEHP
jgi:tetratricopeptide (TPR) repeat protein